MTGMLGHTKVEVPAADSATATPALRHTPQADSLPIPATADGPQFRPEEGSANAATAQARTTEGPADAVTTQAHTRTVPVQTGTADLQAPERVRAQTATGPDRHTSEAQSAAPATGTAHPSTAPMQSRTGDAPAGGTNAAHRTQAISSATNFTRTDTLSHDTLSPDTLFGDSLRAMYPYPAFGTADSLTAASPTLWRDTTAAALFGARSVTVEPTRMPLAAPPSLTENAVFQSFVLLLAATYAMLLYRNLGDVRTLLGRISRDTATGERLSEDPGGSGFSRFLNIATAIGMLFMGVMVVKYGDSLMPRQPGETLPHGAVLLLSLVATLACCVVAAFQTTAVRLAGAVTLSQAFISQLVLLKRTYFSLAVIVTSPALLLFALCPRGTGGVWFCVVAIELIVTAILYLRETLNLFISKKISILHWFLYLCTVEIFPISLLWLLAVR